MSARTKHPHLVLFACRVYGAVIWAYPAPLRQEFRQELVVTFRNLAEDALNGGRPLGALLFIAHIAADLLRSVAIEPPGPAPRLSMLGIASVDDEACGCLDCSSVDASLFFAALGVVLLIAGWYGYLTVQSTYLGHHRIV